jgi:hypothetical protein
VESERARDSETESQSIRNKATEKDFCASTPRGKSSSRRPAQVQPPALVETLRYARCTPVARCMYAQIKIPKVLCRM